MPDRIDARVIIAREEEKAASLVASLEDKGIRSYAVPFTRIVFDLSSKLPSDIHRFDWFAFTSANGVRAFAEILNESGMKLDHNTQIAAVGPSTAAEIKDKFGIQSIIPESNNAASLADLILRLSGDRGNLRVFWPCGREALPDFGNVMRDSGAAVTQWTCYRSESVKETEIRSKLESLLPWDLVFFAAPSAVDAFSASWEDKSGFIAAAIGPTTGERLRLRGFGNIITSKGTSIAECAEAIEKALINRVRS